MTMLRAHRRERPGRRGKWNDRFPPDAVRIGVWLLVIAASLVGIGVFMVARAEMDRASQREPKTLCLLHAPSRTATLMLVDRTDPLTLSDRENFQAIVRHAAASMLKNDRLTIVPFDGELGRTPVPIFDFCAPGTEHEIDEMQEGRGEVRRKLEEDFLQPLEVKLGELIKPHRTDFSPIAEQVERIATNPAIGWQGEHRVLAILTDGLQYTTSSPIYKDGRIRLPKATRGLLEGVTVRYYLLANAQRSDLQLTQTQSAWKTWFEDAGAEVEIYAPGFVVAR
jgi:hypothetical protein